MSLSKVRLDFDEWLKISEDIRDSFHSEQIVAPIPAIDKRLTKVCLDVIPAYEDFINGGRQVKRRLDTVSVIPVPSDQVLLIIPRLLNPNVEKTSQKNSMQF